MITIVTVIFELLISIFLNFNSAVRDVNRLVNMVKSRDLRKNKTNRGFLEIKLEIEFPLHSSVINHTKGGGRMSLK